MSLKIKFWPFLTWLVQLSSTQIKNLFDYTIFISKRLYCVRCAKLCSTSVVILTNKASTQHTIYFDWTSWYKAVQIKWVHTDKGGRYSKWVLQHSKPMPIAIHGGLFISNEDCTSLNLFGGKSFDGRILNTILKFDGQNWSLANYTMTRRRSDFVILEISNGSKCSHF